MSDTDRPILLISGAGEGLAASIATTFAQSGYDVVGLARSDLDLDALSAIRPQRGVTAARAAIADRPRRRPFV